MQELSALHKSEFGSEPDVIAQSPGKLLLIGAHTEIDEGYVLPMAIDRYVQVAVSKRNDNSLRFLSADLKERKRTTITNLRYRREDRWANFSKGVIFSFLQSGCTMKGLNITISGNIPQKVGLGSSAAIEIATSLAVNTLYKLGLTDAQMIESSRQSEARFMERSSVIVPQFTVCRAKKDNLLYIDTRTLEYEQIPFQLKNKIILLTDSRVPRELLMDDEHEEGFKDEFHSYLDTLTGGRALRDHSKRDLATALGRLPEKIRRRCLHIVEENQRVLDAKKALGNKDWDGLGKIMNRAHQSIRDNYEASCPEVDWLVKRAQETEGVYGSCMTGEGYGGCTVSIMEESALESYKNCLEEYERIFGFEAKTHIVKTADGGTILKS